MRFINKKRITPISFGKIVQPILKTEGNNGYNSLGNVKSSLLEYLIKEQHNLCAYCNQSISKNTATIEHFICQSHNSNYDLNYHNLFAVCKGNEGVVTGSHCDKYRANGSKNDYFFPFIFFKNCLTSSWNQTNPFFDVEFNKRTGVISGKIIAKETNIDGYPSIKKNIEKAIEILNLNAPILIEARKNKWEMVLLTKNIKSLSWQNLFNYYLENAPYTDYIEFVLLAIRKQES